MAPGATLAMALGALLLGLTIARASFVEGMLEGDAMDMVSPHTTLASLLPEPADTCPDLRREYDEKKVILKNLEDGMLGDLCGEDDMHCTKVIVTSNGPAAVVQGTRLGLYFLRGWNQQSVGEKYPSYFRPVSEQHLFFMHEINGEDGPGAESTWEYWHTYIRWVIGPVHNKALGGIMIKPYDLGNQCPWQLKYHDVNEENLWNPLGNPWRRDDSIFVHCYNEKDWPEFGCNCQRLNVSSSDRVQEYHPDRLGEYVLLSDKAKEGYLGPVYAKIGDGPPSYLYSHHPKGKVPPARVLTPSCQVWTIGSSETTWSLRLNKLSDEEEFTCPLDTLLDKQSGWEWEYLQKKETVLKEDGHTELDKEVWLTDLQLKVECVQGD